MEWVENSQVAPIKVYNIVPICGKHFLRMLRNPDVGGDSISRPDLVPTLHCHQNYEEGVLRCFRR